MIAVDTSAIIAIVFDEPERPPFLRLVRRANKALISTVSVVEARVVVYGRRGQRGIVIVDDVLRLPMFEIVRRELPSRKPLMRLLWPTAGAVGTRQI